MTTLTDHIQEKAKPDPSDTLTATAVGSFLTSMRSHAYKEVTKESLRMWIVDMAIDGLKVSTRKKYFSRIYTIYREWKTSPGENPFEGAKEAADFDFQWGSREADANLELLDRLLYRPKDAVAKEYINLFLYLFYNPMVATSDAVNLKFDDCGIDCPQIDEIIDEQKEIGRRKTYVFGPGRGRKSESQILKETAGELKAVAGMAGMKIDDTAPRNSILSLWIAAALKAGIPVADIRAVVSTIPPEYSSLCLVPEVSLSNARKREIIRRVADSVNNRPRQWFVMKMRSGQNPDTVKAKIKETTEGILDKMLFYYPTHTVIQQKGKGKSVRREVPFVPGVLFFKISRNLVPLLMNRIGDVAWCFKYTNTADSQYCTVSRNEMEAFQRCIGEFSPDVRMELEVRETPLEKGTVVRINGGGRMTGEEGVIESVRNINGTRTYTLSLTKWLQAKWTVRDMEEIYLEPVG